MDAVETIAADVGMPLPSRESRTISGTPVNQAVTNNPDTRSDTGSQSANLYDCLDTAAKYYRKQLKQFPQAIAYLKKRGITGQTAKQFGIGYAPDGWQNLAEVFADYDSAGLEHPLAEAGLVIIQEGKKNYDRFRGRIMFPIFNHKRKIVGFGGRVLDHHEPKYLNSPETPLFIKSRELYNLPSASLAARKAGHILVVEGYMDVIMLAQYGIAYAVATLGTATTSQHIQKLLRYTDEVIFCFDGDQAGFKAAWRALETSLSQLKDGKNIKFMFLPDGEDPDSYIRRHGPDKFENLLQEAMPLSLFLCNELSRRVNLETDEGRVQLIKYAEPLLSQINTRAPILAFMIKKRLAELAHLHQHHLLGLPKFSTRETITNRSSRVTRSLSVTPCRRLIQILLHNPVYSPKMDRALLDLNQFPGEEMKLLIALVDFLNEQNVISSDLTKESIMLHFDQTPYQALLRTIAQDTPIMEADWDIDAEFAGGLARLREIQRKLRMAELHAKPFNLLTPQEKQELQQLAMS